MQVFDLAEERRLLDDPHTGYRWELAQDYDEAAANSVAGNWASADLRRAIYCILVGYDTPGEELLARARHWLRYAIDNDEKPPDYQKYSTEARRYRDLSLSNWLLEGRNDNSNLQNWMKCADSARAGGRPSKYISFALPIYIDAGAIREALALFDASPLKPAQSLSRIVSEGQMCYVLCRHLLGQEYSGPEVAAALQRFLNRAVNYWLLHGDALAAARWMKIVHWNGHEQELTAKQALLKCYDYLKSPIAAGPDNIP